jgi:hypothetical protein
MVQPSLTGLLQIQQFPRGTQQFAEHSISSILRNDDVILSAVYRETGNFLQQHR